MIIRAAKRFHVNLELDPRDLAELNGELVFATSRCALTPRLRQLRDTLKGVAEICDMDISSNSDIHDPAPTKQTDGEKELAKK